MTVPASISSPRLFETAEYRSDGRAKVTGQMQYTADIQRPGALWAAFVESPHAHARIVAIDLRAARAVGGVHAVLTADDIGRPYFGRSLRDWPVLAFETVRFAGDRVAMVAAESLSAAEEAARAVVVTYDPLPAVLDITAALEAGAPVIHPDRSRYRRVGEPAPGEPAHTHPNIYTTVVRTTGSAELEPIFENAFRVFEHTFESPRQHAGFIEPRATLVWIDGDVVHVHSPNKTPFLFRRQFSEATGIAEDRIVIEPSAIGGDFGGKGLTVDELPCYYLARATGRPVRYVTSYSEELRRGPTRHKALVTLKSAVDRDGTLLAHASTVRYDGGAYAAAKPMVTLLPGNGYGSIPYRVPNVRIEISGVYTNTLPGAHVRGPADLQTFTAWEQHVDLIARALGIDPIEMRLRNVVRDGEPIISGEVMNRPMASEVLRTLRRELSPITRGAGAGRGISLTSTHMGSGNASARLRLSADGVIDVLLGAVDQGAGVATVVRRVVAACLEIEPERVFARRISTLDAFPDPGSGHSRVTHVVGRAALDAAERLKERLEALRRDPDESFDDLARRACAEGEIEIVGSFVSDHGTQVPADMSFAAYAVDVEVDGETGQVSVRDVLLVIDVGRIINPIAHRGQVLGGFAFGFGEALTEEVRLNEDGAVLTPTLGDYKLPTTADIPPIRVVLLEAVPGDGPYGARAIGELCNIGVPAAVMNAVHDAVGIRVARFPVRAEDVYEGIAAARQQMSSL